MAEPHQPPFPQQQQGMASWYSAPPHPYQASAPPQQHHAMPWSAAPPPPPPPGDQSFNYSQPSSYHHQQGDFYSQPQQVQQQYPLPPQPAQPQFTYMYGQQDQVWQANNSWGYQQWPYPAQNASLSQEEVWAAKARAWAASKAVQDEPRSAQPGPTAPQVYQDYTHQHRDPHPLEGQQHSLQPPGQEAAGVSYYQNASNQGQSVPVRPSEHPTERLSFDQPMQDIPPLVTSETGFDISEQKPMLGGGQPQSNDMQAVFSSSYAHDTTASYRLDNAISGPPGTDRLDPMPQPPPKQLPAAPMYTQQATHLLPQSQASPLVSQPRFAYTEKPSPSGYEQHQQQQVPSSYHQPPPPPPPPLQQQSQQLPPQPQYQSSVTMEGLEGEFGLSPASLQNWAPVGGPGMPFPPAMGAGTSQFDPLHAPHQIPVTMFGRPDGPQGLGFPSSGPFVAGASPSLGAGPGTSVRPLFIPDGFIERPKKAAVPSWLREEIMKKKAAGLQGNATGTLLSDESSGVNGGEPAIPLNQRLGISDKLRSGSPGLSDEEEDDLEEEIEAARNAAINQEIKRLLTEVLLKVTGDLFDEIAQEVLDEDSDDILQVKVSPDQQGRSSQTSASPPVVVPSLSGRVLVSSIKSHGTSDTDGDKESADSGVTAGDVLGLGNYASDDETLGSKDYEEPLKGGEAKTEQQDHMILDSAAEGNLKENAHSAEAVDGPVASVLPVVQKIQNTKEHDRNNDTQIPLVKQEKDEGEKRRQHEVGKKRLREQDYVDARNGKGHTPGDLDVPNIQGRLSAPKEDQSRAHAAGPKENPSDRRQSMSEQVGKSLSTERSNTGSKGEKQLQDKRETKPDTTARLVSGKGSITPAASRPSSASFEKLDNKDSGFKLDPTVKEKRKEEKREEKYKDPSGKEKKREEKTKVISDTSGKEKNREERIKDSKEDNAARGLDAGAKDSGRDKRKEKVKEKAKPREKEHDRDRRKHEKKGREGRSRRADAVEKKVRHRSSSSSSSGGAEGSSSSSSDKSRGRSGARRSSRQHNAMSSPGRSRKRRVSRSRSRSRSRSPHAKHTHRRNAPSPSHEKSRRSGSKSPVHRRRRG